MKIKKILVVMAIATLILAMAIATASATTDIKNEKKDTEISIESKEKKVSTYKIKWDANGGKIGSKKTKLTNVKRGSKIGKLAATPKRSEYTFKGWYTKKSGGKKISKNTKPSKSVTYFAQWKKKSRALNAEEKKLVGAWVISYWGINRVFVFRKDGTWSFQTAGPIRYGKSDVRCHGNYQAKNGKLYFTNVISASKSGYNTPFIFTKYDYYRTEDKAGTYKWCNDPNDGDCLILSILYSSNQHFTRAGTGEYSYLPPL